MKNNQAFTKVFIIFRFLGILLISIIVVLIIILVIIIRRKTEVNIAFQAAKLGNSTKIREYLKKNPGLVNARDEFNSSIFYIMPEEKINSMLELFNKVELKNDESKDTLLHIAVEKNHKEIFKFLIETNADVNTVDKWSRTPLHYAASTRDSSKEMVELLIKKGANVNAKDCQGMTPLHWSALSDEGQNYEVSELLISHGANVNTKDYQGMTPLHCAAIRGNNDVIKLLILKGSDVNSRNNEEKTPLTIALEVMKDADRYKNQKLSNRCKENADLLHKYGAKE